MAIKALPSIAAYLQQLSVDPGFENEAIVAVERANCTTADDGGRETWDTVNDADKPIIQAVDQEELHNQRMWNRFEEKGSAVQENIDGGSGQNAPDGNH